MAIVLLGLVLSGSTSDAQDSGVRLLLTRVEGVVRAGDASAYLALLAPTANLDRARDFASSELGPHVSRAVLQERDRQALAGTVPDSGFRLLVDVFAEFGSRARIATWRLDVKRAGEPGTDREWSIADQERLSSIENIYHLSLDSTRAFTAHDLKIAAEDIDLTLPNGTVFVANVDFGVTALVLLGKGTVHFRPAPATERGQVKIFCGSDTLDTGFDAFYVRVNPGDFESFVTASQLQAKAVVDPRELRRALDIFRVESQKSFGVDLGDLSREEWSVLPGPGDFLAEIRTPRFGTLTYAKFTTEAEDITLFDRKHRHNIALYASKDKLAQRGRFYNEDDIVGYEILDYDVDLTVTPGRLWIDGRVRLHLKVRSSAVSTLSLRLADSLVVQSITSDEHGRLVGIRVKNQNTVIVNLPTTVAPNSEMTLTIAYAGRLEPQSADKETATLDQREESDSQPNVIVEPSFLYSSGSYWYPQAPVSDYATARMRITVPSSFECVASGELEPGFPGLLTEDGLPDRKVYVFSASRPLRYLAFIVSRFARAGMLTIAFPPAMADTDTLPDSYPTMNLSVEANPSLVKRGHDLTDRAADIATFYESLVGDSPYSSFTVALIENDLPAGHSPGYFAAISQQQPTSRLVWHNDPTAFSGYADFFIAHELAHQWWGQAVGWSNYHEQWLSEGFAQYFSALYAQHERGDDAFADVLQQLSRWGMSTSHEGPIYLGYRLGHIRDDSRVFRALVYNKGAAVLHMLRRLLGDDAFFRGLRRFYRESKFHKVGTEDLRVAMEGETGRPLQRFFDRWIYGSTLPRLKVSYRIEGSEAVLKVEQIGELFDLPVTVVLHYAGGKPVKVMIPVTDATVEKRVPLTGILRGIEVSKNDGTMAEIAKN